MCVWRVVPISRTKHVAFIPCLSIHVLTFHRAVAAVLKGLPASKLVGEKSKEYTLNDTVKEASHDSLGTHTGTVNNKDASTHW